MIKTYDKKYSVFKFDYWQGAKLVGKFLMPKLESVHTKESTIKTKRIKPAKRTSNLS